ncbi:MAG: hypothetical protein ACR2NP_23090 [Pirellulaceae bacterium]
MDRNNPLDDFASLLGDMQPTAPDISPGSVMFEAGRKLGCTEAQAAQSRSLRLWRAAAACSLVAAIASVSIWLVPRQHDNNQIVENNVNALQPADPDNSGAEPANTESPQGRQPGDSFAGNPLWDLMQQESVAGGESILARRQRMLQQGVSGLPELVLNPAYPVTASSRRGELMDQLLENESL